MKFVRYIILSVLIIAISKKIHVSFNGGSESFIEIPSENIVNQEGLTAVYNESEKTVTLTFNEIEFMCGNPREMMLHQDGYVFLGKIYNHDYRRMTMGSQKHQHFWSNMECSIYGQPEQALDGSIEFSPTFKTSQKIPAWYDNLANTISIVFTDIVSTYPTVTPYNLMNPDYIYLGSMDNPNYKKSKSKSIMGGNTKKLSVYGRLMNYFEETPTTQPAENEPIYSILPVFDQEETTTVNSSSLSYNSTNQELTIWVNGQEVTVQVSPKELMDLASTVDFSSTNNQTPYRLSGFKTEALNS